MPFRSSHAYYAADVAALVAASPAEVIGTLVTNSSTRSSFSVEPARRDAWLLQITVLPSVLVGVDGTIFLEFVVPRIGSCLDVALFSGPVIFAIEFAVGESGYRPADIPIVKAVLDCEAGTARELLAQLCDRYPIALTRDLPRAKRWIREHARGSERYGLVASSGAQRLKPHAIDIRVEINPVHWLLNNEDDVRARRPRSSVPTIGRSAGRGSGRYDLACGSVGEEVRELRGRPSGGPRVLGTVDADREDLRPRGTSCTVDRDARTWRRRTSKNCSRA